MLLEGEAFDKNTRQPQPHHQRHRLLRKTVAQSGYSRCPRPHEIPHQQDSAERAFNKLARTFAAQVEALKRYRSGGEQTVRVEHVTVNEGGQAWPAIWFEPNS
jgi:hypothetical protein